jgi:hypothetical protein
MKRIPFGGLKPCVQEELIHTSNRVADFSCDNEENPLRGIETSGLTPRPPSLRGKGSRAPLPASGKGWGRGFFDLTPGPLPCEGRGSKVSPPRFGEGLGEGFPGPNPPAPFPAREGGARSPLPTSVRGRGRGSPLPASGRGRGRGSPLPLQSLLER